MMGEVDKGSQGHSTMHNIDGRSEVIMNMDPEAKWP
jgi:hypothetical protein